MTIFQVNHSGILTNEVDKALGDKTEVDAREPREEYECKDWGTVTKEIQADITSANQEEETTALPTV